MNKDELCRPRRRAGVLLGLMLAVVLSGCGSATTPNGGASPPAAQPSRSGGFGRFDPAERQRIEACLKAAGISVPTPSPRPDGGPPSGDPTARPSGRPRDGGYLRDPKVRAALKACGITMPSSRPSAPPTTS